jgi:DNA repair exonuclease SbcCD ATPase subunit
MTDIDTPIEVLRERLTQLLADWGAEMSMVLADLEDARGRITALERSSAKKGEVDDLHRRLRGQESLIETLRADAAEAAKLRKALQSSELETEKLRSEVDTKRDLVNALRKDLDKSEELKKELKRKDREMAALASAKQDLEQQLTDAVQRVAQAEESAQDSQDDTTELVAIRAELEAKTELLRSLRTDADRSEALEQRLDEKRVTITKLETSIESQAATIADLKNSVNRWKDRYAALKSGDVTDDTSIRTQPDLSAMTTEIEALDEAAATITDQQAERTLAINMRDALREARSAADQYKQDKPKKSKVAER